MRIQAAAVAFTALALFHSVTAHTRMTNFYVNGVNQGDGTCVRMSMDDQHTTNPIADITSPDMACGVNGETPVPLICPASAGDILTFEYREWPDASNPGAIDPVHRGPCSVYMKKVDSLLASDTTAGAGWFKIFYDGYDPYQSKWCTEKLIANNGHLSVPIPTDLEGGNYLIRPELLALHDASKSPPDPQFYVGCAQLFLKSTGTAYPTLTVDIPANYVNYNMPSMTFNIWDEPMHLPYLEFGPPAYEAGGDAGHSPWIADQMQTEGLEPPFTVLVNANWCGTEVPAYDTEDKCWDVIAGCWDQSKECYAAAPPTGSKNCDLWDQKCDHIDDLCNAGNFKGPPQAGKILTPKPKDLNYGDDRKVIKRQVGEKFRVNCAGCHGVGGT